MAVGWTSVGAQAYISATTHMLLTNLNKAVVVAFAMVYLHESHSWTSVLGVSIAITGGLWFAWARSELSRKRQLQHQEQPTREPPAPPNADEKGSATASAAQKEVPSADEEVPSAGGKEGVPSAA